MAYNLPPPDAAAGAVPDPGFGGLGGLPGLGGFGLPGFGKNFNLDIGGGFGIPGFWGGGFPGWATPYAPVTPLGSLWGFKGDLIVPMVAIGVALFILLLIFLAVKYALAFKFAALEELAGAKKGFRRDVGDAPAEHLSDNNLNRLADIVGAAVYSEGCSRRILCEVGSYARESKQYTSLLGLMDLVVPKDYHDSFSVVRTSAEGHFDCAKTYPCGDIGRKNGTSSDAANEIDVTNGSTAGQKMAPGMVPNSNRTNSNVVPPAPGVTPAPSVFGKFKRTIFN